MADLSFKTVQANVEKLTRQECDEMLEALGIQVYDYEPLEVLQSAVLHCVLAGDIHPRDITGRD